MLYVDFYPAFYSLIIPWLKEPLAVATFCWLPDTFPIKSAVTIVGALELRMLTLTFSGIPGRKLVGVIIT